MKKLIVGVVLVLSASLISCGNDVIFDEDAQLSIDLALIDDYLAENALEAEILEPSQIRMVIKEPGVGEKASFGATVKAYYTGYLLDGTEFDSITSGTPLSFVIDRFGPGSVVAGWNIAFKELAKGGKATIFLPSEYGYGQQSGEVIPSNSVLIFEVEVVDIR